MIRQRERQRDKETTETRSRELDDGASSARATPPPFPHVLSSKHQAIDSLQIWHRLQMAFQRNECSDWVKTYYGSLSWERRGREAVDETWRKSFRRRKPKPAKVFFVFFWKRHERLFRRRSLSPARWSYLDKTAADAVTQCNLNQSAINVAPALFFIGSSRPLGLGWLTLPCYCKRSPISQKSFIRRIRETPAKRQVNYSNIWLVCGVH